MHDLSGLAERIRARASPGSRMLVAVAGPPGSGKTTLAAQLAGKLGEDAAVVPMDGFHLENDVLTKRGLLERKGAPETFDVAGLAQLLQRIKGGGAVTYPTFDRQADRTVPEGGRLETSTAIAIVEGNYLLLDRPPWSDLAPLFDLTIWLDVDEATLRDRLVARWLAHGLCPGAAVARATGNDVPNARFAIENSHIADISVKSSVIRGG